MSSDPAIRLPNDDAKWIINDARTWPKVTYEDLVDYLLESKAYDGKAMKSFRSLYAYNYVQNGWLGDILSCTIDGVHYLKAKVSPSQPGAGRADYSAWVAVGEDCTILTGYCTCPAGEGRSCSHISAIAYAVSLAWSHGVAGESCTDKERLWGRGAGKAMLQEKFEDIDFARPKADAAPLLAKNVKSAKATRLPEPLPLLDHSDLQKHALTSCTEELWSCKGTLLYSILHAKKKPVIETVELKHGEHDIDGNTAVNIIECEPCNTFFQSTINFTASKKEDICEATTTQSSVLWQDVRKLRISSSRVNSVPKTSRADPNKFVTNQIYPRFKGNSATQHGLKHEAEARTWFENQTNQTVSQVGVVIDSHEPYLAASPDGIVDAETILEIKCPTKPLNELFKSGNYDIVVRNGQFSLNPKGRNGYYSQVQMAMHCTGRKKCKLVVWTKEESVIVDVDYDVTFVNATLVRVRQFYFRHLLVRLVDEHHCKRLKLSGEYKQYCEI